LEYIGGGCGQGFNNQGSVYTCEDAPNGPPPTTGESVIECTSEDGTLYTGTISTGDEIVMTSPSGGNLPSQATCTMTSTEGDLLQTCMFDPSGESLLDLKDTFCSLQVVSCDDKSCLKKVKYTYSFENIGSSDMTVTDASITNEDGVTDLLPLLEDKELSPGESTEVCLEETVDICEETKTCVELKASAKPDEEGPPCFDELKYNLTLTPPTPAPATPVPTPSPTVGTTTIPPTDLCFIEVDVACIPPPEFEDCDSILPLRERCEQRPQLLTMRYTGEDCSNGDNIQPEQLYFCEDYQGGPPTTEGATSYIIARDIKGLKTYFEGFVNVGDQYNLFDNGANLTANMNITIYSSEEQTAETLLQTIVFHSSCSSNLFLKDRYGASQVVSFENLGQGLVSCFANVTFAFNIDNVAEGGNNAVLQTLTSQTNWAGTLNLTEQVNGIVLGDGESQSFSETVVIDTTVRQRYTAFTTVTAASPQEFICSATDFLEFTAGSDITPSFPEGA
jgi:hypothetical protein